jgi:hypothetical protein
MGFGQKENGLKRDKTNRWWIGRGLQVSVFSCQSRLDALAIERRDCRSSSKRARVIDFRGNSR